MKKNLTIATLFAILIGLWLASGLLFDEPAVTMSDSVAATADLDAGQVDVRTGMFFAENRTLTRTLRGRTESKRTARVSAEVTGRVVSRPVERGDRVRSGDLLCELAIDDREANVREAQANLSKAEIEYEGALELQGRNLLSEVQIAQVEADLAAARAVLDRQQLNLARTRITAPFDGVIESLPLVEGDLATVGATCATLIDLDPILISANVSEQDIELIQLGNSVAARTSTDRLLQGEVTFVGSQSDATTRTYPVEITVPNPDYRIRAGLTTIVSVNAETVQAHRVSPSLFTLDDAGIIGLRAVDAQRAVVFHPITIIEDSVDGAWVTGLPASVELITVGQEFVAAGQIVNVVTDETTAARES